MPSVCKLCGAYESASVHREPFGRAMAYVFYTHRFQPVYEEE